MEKIEELSKKFSVPFSELEKFDRKVSICTQFCIVLTRFLKSFIRAWGGILSELSKFVGVQIYMAIVYSNKADPSDDTFAALQDRAGLMFNLMINIGFAGIAGAVYNFIPLMPRFLRDYENKLYSPTLFYIIASFFKVPLFIILIALYLAIAILFIGLDIGDSYDKIPVYYATLFTIYMTCSGIGDAASILIQDSEAVQTAMLIISLPMFLTAGYLASVKNFILPLKVLAYITPSKYGF